MFDSLKKFFSPAATPSAQPVSSVAPKGSEVVGASGGVLGSLRRGFSDLVSKVVSPRGVVAAGALALAACNPAAQASSVDAGVDYLDAAPLVAASAQGDSDAGVADVSTSTASTPEVKTASSTYGLDTSDGGAFKSYVSSLKTSRSGATLPTVSLAKQLDELAPKVHVDFSTQATEAYHAFQHFMKEHSSESQEVAFKAFVKEKPAEAFAMQKAVFDAFVAQSSKDNLYLHNSFLKAHGDALTYVIRKAAQQNITVDASTIDKVLNSDQARNLWHALTQFAAIDGVSEGTGAYGIPASIDLGDHGPDANAGVLTLQQLKAAPTFYNVLMAVLKDVQRGNYFPKADTRSQLETVYDRMIEAVNADLDLSGQAKAGMAYSLGAKKDSGGNLIGTEAGKAVFVRLAFATNNPNGLTGLYDLLKEVKEVSAPAAAPAAEKVNLKVTASPQELIARGRALLDAKKKSAEPSHDDTQGKVIPATAPNVPGVPATPADAPRAPVVPAETTPVEGSDKQGYLNEPWMVPDTRHAYAATAVPALSATPTSAELLGWLDVRDGQQNFDEEMEVTDDMIEYVDAPEMPVQDARAAELAAEAKATLARLDAKDTADARLAKLADIERETKSAPTVSKPKLFIDASKNLRVPSLADYKALKMQKELADGLDFSDLPSASRDVIPTKVVVETALDKALREAGVDDENGWG